VGRCRDSFVSYQKLEDNIIRLKEFGVREWEKQEARKERLLLRLLGEYDDGRSRSFLCLAVTVVAPEVIEAAVKEERRNRTAGADNKARARAIRALLERGAKAGGTRLVLRK
jgi:hypothetical protein